MTRAGVLKILATLLLAGQCQSAVANDSSDAPVPDISLSSPALPGFVAKIDAIAEGYHDARIFDGVVIVANKDRTIYKRAFGEANVPFHIPNTLETKVRLASVSKPFTTALILLLVEDGALNLDQSVSSILSDYPDKQGDAVTVTDLLVHSSGIPNYQYTPPYQALQMRLLATGQGVPVTLNDMMAMFRDEPLDFEPGSKYQYSNSNYVILQAIIERVTGKSFADALANRITGPLDMQHTGTFGYRSVIDGLADGYSAAPGGFEAPLQAHDVGVPSPGSIYSTAEDIVRFTQALVGNRFFRDEKTLAMMTEPRIQGYDEKTFRGLGFFSSSVSVGDNKVDMIGHDGWGPPFTANLQYFPQSGLIVFAADNVGSLGDGTHGETVRLTEDIVRTLYGTDVTVPAVPADLALSDLIESQGAKSGVAQFKAKVAREGLTQARERDINGLGYYYMSRGNIEAAVEIFQMNSSFYPQSANTFDSLADGQLRAGNKTAALNSLQKALTLDPDNSAYQKRINDLMPDSVKP